MSINKKIKLSAITSAVVIALTACSDTTTKITDLPESVSSRTETSVQSEAVTTYTSQTEIHQENCYRKLPLTFDELITRADLIVIAEYIGATDLPEDADKPNFIIHEIIRGKPISKEILVMNVKAIYSNGDEEYTPVWSGFDIGDKLTFFLNEENGIYYVAGADLYWRSDDEYLWHLMHKDVDKYMENPTADDIRNYIDNYLKREDLLADTSAGFIETADFFDIAQGSPIIAEITPDVLTNDEFSNSQWFSCYVYKTLKGKFSSDYTMIELCVPRGSMELNESYIVMLKESVDNRFVVSSLNGVFLWSEEIVDNIEKIAIYGEEYLYY